MASRRIYFWNNGEFVDKEEDVRDINQTFAMMISKVEILEEVGQFR
jgi:hypothetical protein